MRYNNKEFTEMEDQNVKMKGIIILINTFLNNFDPNATKEQIINSIKVIVGNPLDYMSELEYSTGFEDIKKFHSEKYKETIKDGGY